MKNLEASIQEYLIIRRSLGYKLKGAESHLYEFAAFLTKRKRHTISTALALEWIAQTQGRSHTSQAQPEYRSAIRRVPKDNRSKN